MDAAEPGNSPPDETPAAPPPEGPEKAPPKRKRGRPPGSKSRKTLERELAEAKKRLEADPFARPVKGAETPSGPSENASGDAKSPDAVEPPPAEEIPPLGIEGARALAPAYYGIVNFGVRFVIRRAPVYKEKPDEGARVAKAMALDPKGWYDANGAPHDLSDDRQAIDPPLIAVMAKLRLTPELALIIATGGILLAKYAAATGDTEILEAVGAMNAQPPPNPTGGGNS